MKTLTMLILFTTSTSVFANAELELNDFYKEQIEKSSQVKEYEWKTATKCNVGRKGLDPVHPERGSATFYECPDKTISFVQPPSTGYKGWDGYCAQTSVSNVTSMMCNRHITPNHSNGYGSDLMPGTFPDTTRRALNKVFSEKSAKNTCPIIKWKVRRYFTAKGWLKAVRADLFGSNHKIRRYRNANTFVNITPTPVLLNAGALMYHWVTVVDFIENKNDEYKCDVVMNTWGSQRTLSCENFIRYGNHTGVSEYVHLGFENQ